MPSLLDQKAKRGVEFRCATSEVHCWCASSPHELERQFCSPAVRDFGPFGAGIHVTVDAGLIAELPDVDLDRVDARTPQAYPFLPHAYGKGRYCHMHSDFSPSMVSNTFLVHNTSQLRSLPDTLDPSSLSDSARHPVSSQTAWLPPRGRESRAGPG